MSVFSVVDLVRGFHQIPMADQDVPKTAIITPFGLFEFLRMPFGLKSAAQAFQRLMDGILREVDFVFVYLDNILIASPDEETHKHHLRALFNLLAENGVFRRSANSALQRSNTLVMWFLQRAFGRMLTE